LDIEDIVGDLKAQYDCYGRPNEDMQQHFIEDCEILKEKLSPEYDP
jgi:hypothetical protein